MYGGVGDSVGEGNIGDNDGGNGGVEEGSIGDEGGSKGENQVFKVRRQGRMFCRWDGEGLRREGGGEAELE